MKVLFLLLILVAMVTADHKDLRSTSILRKFTSAENINKIKATKIPNFKVQSYSVYNMKVDSFKVDSAKLFKTSSGKNKYLQLGGMSVVLKGRLWYTIFSLGIRLDIYVQSLIEEFDSSGKQKTCTADITKDKVTISGWFGIGQKKYDEMHINIKPFIEERLCGMLRDVRQ